jgi:hypothetical protein
MCVDFTVLNSVTQDIDFFIPTADNLIAEFYLLWKND